MPPAGGFDEHLNVVDTVLEGHDRRVASDERRQQPCGFLSVIGLDREEHEIDRTDLLRPVGRADVQHKWFCDRRLDPQAALAHRGQVRPAREKRDLLPAALQLRPVVSACASRPDDGDPHDLFLQGVCRISLLSIACLPFPWHGQEQGGSERRLFLSGPRRIVIVALGAICAVAVVAFPAHPNPARTLAVYGYYVDDDANSWATVQSQGQRLTGIITTNFTFDSSGRIVGIHDARVVDLARSRGSKVHARVANFVGDRWSREVAHAVLTDPDAQARALTELLQILDRYGYDGIHLHLESVAPGDRRALTSFIGELGSRAHARGKAVTVAVPAKMRDQPANDWSGAFDYRALARASDWLVIMAYDEHWSGSRPGPVASLPWVEAVLRYAAGQVPLQKLVLGVAFYGYDWSDGRLGEGVSMREAVARAARAGVELRWDERAQVPYFMTARGITYFENSRSVELKMALALRVGVAGIAAWRLGHELPDVWNAIGTFLKASTRTASR